ncbi:MAG TPA: right-handed parallel beta-helix repeat-containing protein [Longimicrobium sp.]|nr:right-handed parallel beta-helix repeat-containing protein [Longimicrobium sp.]
MQYAGTILDEGGAVLNVKSPLWGAAGDGVADDTAEIQAAVNACPPGGTVFVPAGVYLIEGTDPVDGAGGIKLKSNMTFQMAPGATLKIAPTSSEAYAGLRIWNATDIHVIGGRILGERGQHVGSTGEWGHGVDIRDGHRINITDVIADECWGDGFYVGTLNNALFSSEISMLNVRATHNRRSGLALISAKQVRIIDGRFFDTEGTAPQGGIIMEPDGGGVFNEDVLVSGCHFGGNAYDIYVWAGARNIVLAGNTLRGHGGIMISDRVTNMTVVGNVVETSGTTSQTSALMTVAGTATPINGLRVTGNTFAGGNQVVVDMSSGDAGGLHNVEFSDNTVISEVNGGRLVRVISPGVRLTDNRFVVRGAGGIDATSPDDWTVLLHGVTHAGNVFYRNETTAKNVYASLQNTRLLGDDDYVGIKRGWNGPTGRHSNILGGSVSSGGGIASGSTVSIPVTGVDATTARIAVLAMGGGENGGDPGGVTWHVTSRTISGFTLVIKNVSGVTQSLVGDWVALLPFG